MGANGHRQESFKHPGAGTAQTVWLRTTAHPQVVTLSQALKDGWMQKGGGESKPGQLALLKDGG